MTDDQCPWICVWEAKGVAGGFMSVWLCLRVYGSHSRRKEFDVSIELMHIIATKRQVKKINRQEENHSQRHRKYPRTKQKSQYKHTRGQICEWLAAVHQFTMVKRVGLYIYYLLPCSHHQFNMGSFPQDPGDTGITGKGLQNDSLETIFIYKCMHACLLSLCA